jgi:hypothetical protein
VRRVPDDEPRLVKRIEWLACEYGGADHEEQPPGLAGLDAARWCDPWPIGTLS